MITEVHLVKEEMIEKDLSATKEVIVDLLQGLKKEMITEVHLVKKIANHQCLEKSLEALKRSPLKNLQRNLIFNLSYF